MCRLSASSIISALLVSGTALRADEGILVNDSIIDPLAHHFPTVSYGDVTVNGITFQQDGVTTYKGWQYATYYQGNRSNSTGKVAVARRPLPHGTWETLVLNDYTFGTVDSHNDVVLGICAGDGTIHLSFDHHGNDLNYRVSIPGVADHPTTTAWTPALFGPVIDRLDGNSVMSLVTYPRFIPTPDGKLLFTYRYGGSGGGDEYLHEYDGATHAWSPVAQHTTRSGSYTGTYASGTSRNAYFDNTLFDANGRLHATWCWRETSDVNSNHDLLYAYSDDVGRTWKNQLGVTIAVAGSNAISVNSPDLIGWPIPQLRSLLNNGAMTVDKQGRVHVVALHLPDSEPNQTYNGPAMRYIHYWRGTDGTWRKNETPFNGTRPKLAADDDGRLFLIYGGTNNIQIAAANPAPDPETDPSNSWTDWAPLDLSGGLPDSRGNSVNTIIDSVRWETDRILSVYAQEKNISGTAPTPLHILDYHVSRAAVLPMPLHAAADAPFAPELSWTAGQNAVAHDLYFGTSETAVAAANTSSPEYLGRQTATTRGVGTLSPETTYFWRVDSVDATDHITPGRVWSFTTGTLVPAVAQGAATRSYGGRTTFPVTLDFKDPAITTGGLVLYFGETDGSTDANAWQDSLDFGQQSAGSQTLTVDALANGSLHYRFQITTVHGISWAASSSILEPTDDLSLWAHTALMEITGYSEAETLTDFPVLIRLSSVQLPGFAYDQMLSPPHGDLRFSTPDGQQILPHEVEYWDPAGTSSIWVKLPQLAPGTQLRVWWGRAGQSPPPAAPTWSAFNGVWHLDETLGFATDSAAKTSATSTNLTPAASGVIPGTGSLNGTSSAVAITNSAALNPAAISVEAWVQTSSGTGTPSIFTKDQTSGGTNRVWQFRLNNGKPEFLPFSESSLALVGSPDPVNDGRFHHLCGTWDGSTIRIYVDGVLKNSVAFSGTLRSSQSNRAFIGRSENVSPSYFNGSIDEVRLSSVARSEAWVLATFDNQKPAANFLTASPRTTPDLDGDHLPDGWEMQHFATTSGTDPDPDVDGKHNLLEFALGTDPNSGADPATCTLVPAGAGSPHEFIYQQIADGTGDIGTTYTAAGLQYLVEVSNDLHTWHSGPSVVTWSNRRETLSDGMERVGIHIIDPALRASPQIFTRLRVIPLE